MSFLASDSIHAARACVQQLSIISAHTARLQLSGRLELDEPVEYAVHPSGELNFSLTERTLRLLRRFRTSMESAGYEPDTDQAWVVVWPPLPLSIRIRLDRAEVDDEQDQQKRGGVRSAVHGAVSRARR